jgi:hypothetical protein
LPFFLLKIAHAAFSPEFSRTAAMNSTRPDRLRPVREVTLVDSPLADNTRYYERSFNLRRAKFER